MAELYHGILPDTLSILIPDGSDVVDVQCHIERLFPIRTFVPRPRLGFPFSLTFFPHVVETGSLWFTRFGPISDQMLFDLTIARDV